MGDHRCGDLIVFFIVSQIFFEPLPFQFAGIKTSEEDALLKCHTILDTRFQIRWSQSCASQGRRLCFLVCKLLWLACCLIETSDSSIAKWGFIFKLSGTTSALLSRLDQKLRSALRASLRENQTERGQNTKHVPQFSIVFLQLVLSLFLVILKTSAFNATLIFVDLVCQTKTISGN